MRNLSTRAIVIFFLVLAAFAVAGSYTLHMALLNNTSDSRPLHIPLDQPSGPAAVQVQAPAKTAAETAPTTTEEPPVTTEPATSTDEPTVQQPTDESGRPLIVDQDPADCAGYIADDGLCHPNASAPDPEQPSAPQTSAPLDDGAGVNGNGARDGDGNG